jgi:hypothetical protein
MKNAGIEGIRRNWCAPIGRLWNDLEFVSTLSIWVCVCVCVCVCEREREREREREGNVKTLMEKAPLKRQRLVKTFFS